MGHAEDCGVLGWDWLSGGSKGDGVTQWEAEEWQQGTVTRPQQQSKRNGSAGLDERCSSGKRKEQLESKTFRNPFSNSPIGSFRD